MTADPSYSVFKAVADPTRRKIFHMLASDGSAKTFNEIADRFDISRQAVTKHIKILSKAGLVDIVPQGREKHCYADPKPLKEIYDWISYYDQFWEHKVHLLESYLKKKSE